MRVEAWFCVVFVAFAASCDSTSTGSHVQIIYPRVAGAPAITNLRVTWAGDKFVWEDAQPGERNAGIMHPDDDAGGGAMTVLFTIGGQRIVWNGEVGRYSDQKRYGVAIELGPTGVVQVNSCVHPCPLSQRPWYEPWRSWLSTFVGKSS